MAAALLLLTGSAVAGTAYLRSEHLIPPLPFEPRCVVSGDTGDVTLTLDQSALTSIIVGGSVKRGLPTHAATIAMATAYQESGIRNLDHGDRDSLGIFQQRPSQGWGTADQVQDPWFATGAFYDALIKVPAWEGGDVNDTAQTVQRSGHPQAYAKHEQKARTLARAFSGVRAASITCFDRRESHGDAEAYAAAVTRTLGPLPVTSSGSSVRVAAATPERAWAVAHHAVANAGGLGIAEVRVGGRAWTADASGAPAWRPKPSGLDQSVVDLTLR